MSFRIYTKFKFCSDFRVFFTQFKSSYSNDSKLTFQQQHDIERDNAKRTIAVSLPMASHLHNLYHMCSERFGPIDCIFNYNVSSKDYALVTFKDVASVQSMVDSGVQFRNKEKIPIVSRFMHYFSPTQMNTSNSSKKFPIHYDNVTAKLQKLPQDLLLCETVSEQMLTFNNQLKMDELGVRMRYFTCSFFEDILNGLFPNCVALPFGSSRNGLGKHSSDLDIMLQLSTNVVEEPFSNTKNGLAFMSKKTKSERNFIQSTLEILGAILENMVPKVNNVHVISRARIPIVKFQYQLTALNCDISMCNWGGCHMSEILWTMCQMNKFFSPLLFSVIAWARENKLSYEYPGPWCSSFIFTMLVVAFLQSRPHNSLLPAISTMLTTSKTDFINSNKPSPLFERPNLLKKVNLDTGLDDLLMDFFLYLSQFNFNDFGWSVIHGHGIRKPEPCLMYIDNPCEAGHNICRIIDQPNYLKHLQQKADEALLVLCNNRKKTKNPWGLLSILPVTSKNLDNSSQSVKFRK